MSDIREALSSAFDAAEEAPELEAPAAVEASLEAPAEVTEAQETAAPETPAEQAQRARDETGRFAKKQEQPKPAAVKPVPAAKATAPATPAATPLGQQPQEAAPAAPESTKAPQSWKPAAREHFAKLPPEVQQEVVRREKETAVALQGAAQARALAEGFQRTVEPYRALLTDEPLKVVANLMQTAAQLQTAPPAHKAQLVAQLVRTYGIPIEALDAALAGQPAPQQAGQGGPQHMDPRTLAAQVEQQVVQRLQQQRVQAARAKATQEAESFAQQAEFFDDVREDVADMLELAGRRGVALSLEEAYARATKMHPEVSKVLQQREAAKQANATQASTQRARAAASSVRSQPATGPAASAPADLRGSIAASIERLTGR